MEMPASYVSVVSDFRKDVWEEIRCANLGPVVKLRTKRRTICRWQGHEPTDVLIGILNSQPHRPMIVGMISNPELRGTRVWQSNPDVLVFVVRDRQIGRHRS